MYTPASCLTHNRALFWSRAMFKEGFLGLTMIMWCLWTLLKTLAMSSCRVSLSPAKPVVKIQFIVRKVLKETGYPWKVREDTFWS